MQRDEVTYVNAHGTSTQVGDMAEYRCEDMTRMPPQSALLMPLTIQRAKA